MCEWTLKGHAHCSMVIDRCSLIDDLKRNQVLMTGVCLVRGDSTIDMYLNLKFQVQNLRFRIWNLRS